MPHFFIAPENIQGQSFTLRGPEVHHLLDVRRCKPGEVVHLFDGTGKTYVGRIERVARDEIGGVFIEQSDAPMPLAAVHLYQAIPKGDRFDWLVEKAAELGVSVVTPLITERSTVTEISESKIERWRRLARAACTQCNRADLMGVEVPVRMRDLTNQPLPGTAIIPWEGEDVRTLDETLNMPVSGTVSILIGPEGGFALSEIERARSARIVPVTLGPRILRSETAGLLVSILVLNAAGEYGKMK
jgi:16S rRNA (uracil1498-N3)-methyltransferase